MGTKIVTHPASTPLGVTTDATITRDLQASQDALKIAEVLSARGVAEDRARRAAEFVLRWCDAGAYDAASWLAAERLYSQMDAQADVQRLIHAAPRIRQAYFTWALHAIRGFEDVFTGLVHRRVLEQAVADYYSHRAQILQRVIEHRAALFDVSGVEINEDGGRTA